MLATWNLRSIMLVTWNLRSILQVISDKIGILDRTRIHRSLCVHVVHTMQFLYARYYPPAFISSMAIFSCHHELRPVPEKIRMSDPGSMIARLLQQLACR